MQIDYSALTSEVTSDDIKTYKKQDITATKSPKNIIFIVIMVAMVLYVMSIYNYFVETKVSFEPIYLFTIVPFVFGLVFIQQKDMNSIIRLIRLNRFAKTNNLIFQAIPTSTSSDGLIFQVGSGRITYDVLSSDSGNIFEIGNHNYTVGSGDDRKLIRNGYIKVLLNRKLPHMVLDSRKNNTNIFGISISNLPVSFKKDQMLELEGDFNSSFTLYAPKDYERDALYVFSPDLMALFIDSLGNYDAEIIDEYLFIYSQTTFDLLNQSILEHIFKIISVVGNKTVSQTEHYSDEKVGVLQNNIVNESGRRLKRRIPKAVIISTIAFLVVFGLNISIHYIPDIIKFFLK